MIVNPKRVLLVMCCLFFGGFFPAAGQEEGPRARVPALKKRLAASIRAGLDVPLYGNVDAGIRVQVIGGGEKTVLYEQEPDTAFIPASAIKVFTSAVSLIKFGPDYRFKTPLKALAPVNNGVLEGDLYIQGRGDPALKTAHLDAAAKALKASGIHTIAGDVVYDTSFLDTAVPRYPPNARHFYAPPGALTVNYNWVHLDLDEGPPPRLTPAPQTRYVQLEVDIRVKHTSRPGRPAMTYKKLPFGDRYTIEGTVTDWDLRYKYLNLCVTRPGLFGATLLKEALERAGIEVKGSIRKGVVPDHARVLHTIETPEILHSVAHLNQESNNVIAELLNKDLGAYFQSPPGTREKGLAMMRAYCTDQLGFEKKSFAIADASGLSPLSRFTPRQFTSALDHFYGKLGTTFVETLAPQGRHPHAMHPVPPAGMRAFVKSGTLSVTGVNTVVGYIFDDRSGAVYAFAILCTRRGKGGMAYSGTFTNPLLSAVLQALK